jgi:hypothetical protein
MHWIFVIDTCGEVSAGGRPNDAGELRMPLPGA